MGRKTWFVDPPAPPCQKIHHFGHHVLKLFSHHASAKWVLVFNSAAHVSRHVSRPPSVSLPPAPHHHHHRQLPLITITIIIIIIVSIRQPPLSSSSASASLHWPASAHTDLKIAPKSATAASHGEMTISIWQYLTASGSICQHLAGQPQPIPTSK